VALVLVENIVDEFQEMPPASLDCLEVLLFSFSSSDDLSSKSVNPRTPVNGVRISWLMLARNSLLDWLAASAALRALTNSVR